MRSCEAVQTCAVFIMLWSQFGASPHAHPYPGVCLCAKTRVHRGGASRSIPSSSSDLSTFDISLLPSDRPLASPLSFPPSLPSCPPRPARPPKAAQPSRSLPAELKKKQTRTEHLDLVNQTEHCRNEQRVERFIEQRMRVNPQIQTLRDLYGMVCSNDRVRPSAASRCVQASECWRRCSVGEEPSSARQCRGAICCWRRRTPGSVLEEPKPRLQEPGGASERLLAGGRRGGLPQRAHVSQLSGHHVVRKDPVGPREARGESSGLHLPAKEPARLRRPAAARRWWREACRNPGRVDQRDAIEVGHSTRAQGTHMRFARRSSSLPPLSWHTAQRINTLTHSKRSKQRHSQCTAHSTAQHSRTHGTAHSVAHSTAHSTAHGAQHTPHTARSTCADYCTYLVV